MKITWLGHSGFRIEIGDQVLLVDPWLTGNPMFPADRREEAISGTTHILLTHGHGDHSGDAVALSAELGVPVVGIYDLMNWWTTKHDIQTVGFNKGGTVALGDVKVTLVNAVHSSSVGGDGRAGLCGGRGRVHDRGRRAYDLHDRRYRCDGRHEGVQRSASPRYRHLVRGRAFHDGYGTGRVRGEDVL